MSKTLFPTRGAPGFITRTAAMLVNFCIHDKNIMINQAVRYTIYRISPRAASRTSPQ
jgi:hypothetical protein